MMSAQLRQTMLGLADDMEATIGKGFDVDTYTGMTDNGVPIIQFVVNYNHDHCGIVRQMTAAEAREIADLLEGCLDGKSTYYRGCVMEWAALFREVAEVAEAGGRQ